MYKIFTWFSFFHPFKATNEAYNNRHHYLLSTVQIPGIYSSQFNSELAAKEVEIKSARRRDQVRKQKTVATNTTARCPNSQSVLPPIGKAAQVRFIHSVHEMDLEWTPLHKD